MTENITKSELYNSFKLFREVFTGITALSALHPNFGLSKFYYEDFPNLKGANNKVSFPLVVLPTEVDTLSLTMQDKKMYPMTTTVSIYVDHFVEESNPKLNDYMNAVANWFLSNKHTMRYTYKLKSIKISKDRDTEVIKQKKFTVGELTFNYHVTLDTS